MSDKPRNPFADANFKSAIKEPRNPFATEDFANAIKEATDKLSKNLGKIGEQVKVDFPFLAYDDMYPEYGGRMRLKPTNLWESVVDTLTDEGYAVTVTKEDATETEREMDGIDKWIVIEFDEVE